MKLSKLVTKVLEALVNPRLIHRPEVDELYKRDHPDERQNGSDRE